MTEVHSQDGPISFGYANVGEVNLHYAKAGDGDRLVLLLHGFPEFWYSWRHQLAALSDEYTVVAPDLRGYNLSDRPANVADYTLEHLTEDVAGLIRHFGRDKAAVIGHDWGASIAWATALRKPEIIWKLGALQVPPASVWKKNQSAAQLFASWYMFFFQLPALPEFFLSRNNYESLSRALREATVVPGVISDDEIAEYRESWGQPGAITAMLNYYRANILKRMFGKSPAIQKIDVP
ncbi:MAG: alpha/beta fold hydrolase, partial [Pyrinomonadaceae bacterium]